MMILARYEYYRPSTVEEAVSMLKKENTIIAGGSDVMPQLKTATIAPEALIDLSKISEMHTVEETDDGIYIGAMVALSHLAKNELILRKLIALSQAARNVASPQIRNRGTVGGNLMQARRCFYGDRPASTTIRPRSGAAASPCASRSAATAASRSPTPPSAAPSITPIWPLR